VFPILVIKTDIETGDDLRCKMLPVDLPCNHVVRYKIEIIHSNCKMVLCKSCLTNLIKILDKEILES